MNKSMASRPRTRPIDDALPATPDERVCFFEADSLTFGVRVTDGAALVAGSRGATARTAIQRRLSERPVNHCDLMRSAHVPAFNRSRLTLMIAQQCNLRCIYCYGGDGQYGNPGIADREESLHLIERFLKRQGPKRRTINFFGGEPLLCFDLLRELTTCAVRHAVRYDRYLVFTMTTNGTLVTPAISAWLARHRFSVMVSIDGDAQMHGRNRPDAHGSNSWTATINGAKLLLRDLGHYAVTARATLTEGFPDIDSMVRGLEDIGFQSVALCAVEPGRHSKVPTLNKADYQRLRTAVQTLVVPTLLDTGKRAPWDPLKSTIQLLQTGKRRERACGVGNLSSAVSSDGHLYPCHRYVGDRRFIIGKSIDGLVDHTLPGFAAFEKSRRSALRECDGCIAKAFCAGSCAHIAVGRMDKGLAPHDEEICEFIQMGVREAIRVIAAQRVPPERGTAVMIGPEYMKRPFRLKSLRGIFEKRRNQAMRTATWNEYELSILRASHGAIVSLLGDVVPALSEEMVGGNETWLTHGLVRLLTTEIFGTLTVPELKLVGSGAALVEFAGTDKEILGHVIRAGQEVIAEELRIILTEDFERSDDNKATHHLLALPSLGVARLRNDHILEDTIKSFVAMVLPLHRLLENFVRLLASCDNPKTNPWYLMIQETFGDLSAEEAASTARHPAVIDMVTAQIMTEMRRLCLPSSWQQPALEVYTTWIIRRLHKLATSTP
jgi:radical SAM protein with 4Fe4S-binding SPASM domain